MPRQVKSCWPEVTTLLAWPALLPSGGLEMGLQIRPWRACLTWVPECGPLDCSLSANRNKWTSLWLFSTGSIFKYFPSPTKKKIDFLTFPLLLPK